MKKNLFMVAAVALVAAVSCNKEGLGDNTQTPSSIVFTAGIDTKTVLVPDTDGDATVNHQIHWESGDEIVVDGVTFKTTDSGAKANFTTESAFTADNDYYAIYPASAGTELESVTVPAAQEVEAGKFNPSAVVSVAKSTTTSLEFKNVTSLLKFQVPAPATTVTISSSSPLAGEVSVNYNAGEPTWTAVNTVNTITVTGSFQTEKDYYVAVLPGAKTNFEVRIDGYYSKYAASVTLERSVVMNMKTLPAPVIRLYIQSEYTHFDMNIYAWGIDGVSLPNEWPGKPLKWDAEEGKYYYDFPYEIKGKKLNYIINNGIYQTADLDDTISSSEYTNDTDVNWHWLYFKPSNNWKTNNPWYAACFTGGDGEYWMRSIGPDENGVYGFVQPPTRTKVEFARMNPEENDMNWSNKWNSTAQQTIPTDGKNYFQCTEGWWDAHNDPWTTYTLPTE